LSIRDELVRLAQQRGDHGMLLRASYAQVWNGVELGDLAAVDSAIDTLESLAQLVREPHFRWRAKVCRVMRAIIDGRMDLVEERAQEALQLGAVAGEDAAYHTYVIHHDLVLAFEGRAAEREVIIRDICARYPGLAGWRAVLAGIELDLGRKESARAVLEELLANDLEVVRRETFLLSVLAPTAELCARIGDARSARAVYEAILPYESHHGIVSFGVSTHGPITRHLGLLARRFGDLALAARHFEHAIAACERMPSPTFLSLSCLAYARCLLKSDRPRARAQAAELLLRASEVAEGVQLGGLVAVCRGLMRSEQLPAPRIARSSRS
jgi:tetratricopeptide (TPR) repeat protein